MDPIYFYEGLLDLSKSLATIVNVARNTTAGRKTLDSTLKELPVLFALLEEIRTGVFQTNREIPQSATLAFQQCQADLEDVIACLSQRGLMGLGQGHGGFSQLQAHLSGHSLEDNSSDKSKQAGKPENLPKKRHKFRERLHLMNVQSLAAVVKSFKNSVLLLRHIAVDLQTQTLLLAQSNQQQAVINEIRATKYRFQSPGTLSQDESTVDQNTSLDNEPKYASQLNESPTKIHHQPPLVSETMSYHTPKRRPSEYGRLEVKNFSTIYDITVGIPRPVSKYNEPAPPDYILARIVLDTGSDNSAISQKMIARHNIGHLTRKLSRKMEWTLGDGIGKVTSEAKVRLTWYNNHDAMRSYTTEFYIVEVDIYDMLLGGDFYGEYGPLKGNGLKEQFMMAHFAIGWRSKEQRRREEEAEKVAKKEAKAKLQQGYENAEKSSQDSSVKLNPRLSTVTENTKSQTASAVGVSQDLASNPAHAVNEENANAFQQASGKGLGQKTNGQSVASNPDTATSQSMPAELATPLFNAVIFENNFIIPVVPRPSRNDAETPPKTPEREPQKAGSATLNGKILLGQPVEDVGMVEGKWKVQEAADGRIAAISESGPIEA